MEQNITVYRYSSQSQTTLSVTHIDKKFESHSLEDRYREVKVKGSTRIPAGKYKVTLRTVGGHHERYLKSYPSFHKGMLWVRDVPEFEYILIHKGNDKDDTEGCLILGEDCTNNRLRKGEVYPSTPAYIAFYKKVVDAAERGELFIEYIDLDIPYND